MMRISGFSEDQLAKLAEIWQLGSPIDVGDFLSREDIPEDVKDRVRPKAAADANADAEKYRLMQAAILIEVAKLDRERWKP